MKFGILVQNGPYNNQASDSAYHFVRAALNKGHEITGIFFYNDGVYNAISTMEPPTDDRHIGKRWSEIGAKGVDIVICIAAGKRRGIVDSDIMPNMRISGLGQLIDMTLNSDRMISFGA